MTCVRTFRRDNWNIEILEGNSTETKSERAERVEDQGPGGVTNGILEKLSMFTVARIYTRRWGVYVSQSTLELSTDGELCCFYIGIRQEGNYNALTWGQITRVSIHV